MWVVGDLDSSEGLQLVRDTLDRVSSEECSFRLGFIHVPPAQSNTEGYFSTVLYHLISLSALQTITPQQLLDLVTEVQGTASLDNLDTAGRIFSEGTQEVFRDTPLHALTSSGWETADVAAAAEFWKAGSEIANALNIKPDHPYLLVNGRVGL
jgi:UDP-glucose:glycoprotein glucosyltransferase